MADLILCNETYLKWKSSEKHIFLPELIGWPGELCMLQISEFFRWAETFEPKPKRRGGGGATTSSSTYFERPKYIIAGYWFTNCSCCFFLTVDLLIQHSVNWHNVQKRKISQFNDIIINLIVFVLVTDWMGKEKPD